MAGDIAAQVAANIKRVVDAAKGAAKPTAEQAGEFMISALQEAVSGPSPSSPGEPPGYDSGELSDSFVAEQGEDRDGAYVDLGNTAEYSAFLEFGTIDMDARPYFRTTIEANLEAVGGFLGDEVVRAEQGAA